MKIYSYLSKIFIATAVLSLSSCETIDLDQTENPSTLNQSYLDPIYTFNYVQLQLPDFVNSANSFTQRVTRQMAMTGGNTYDNAFAPVNFDTNWSTAYNMLNAIKIMEPKAREQRRFYALGASKVIRCYVLMTLVDMYGNIPYSDALQGNDNLTPKYDSGAAVYSGILAELDEAIAVLNTADNNNPDMTDLYYETQKQAGWVTLAKTLKLKLYNNARLAGADIGVADIGSAMSAIVTAGDYIDQESEDFAFKYGNSRNLPNTRHPLYNDQYELGGGAYIANYYMWAMTKEKNYPSTLTSSPKGDPRTFFYFYKQRNNPNDFNSDTFTLPGRARPSHYNELQYSSFYDHSILTPYVTSNWVGGATVAADGFWGRDHGDNSGIPPDADLRTVGGVYPIGGKFGTDGQSVQGSGTDGALGAGIMPILLSSYVHFIIAEASLTVPGFIDATRARTEFTAGIDQSVHKTVNFDKEYTRFDVVTDNSVMSVNQKNIINQNIAFYTPDMLAKYDAATPDGKLEMIVKEFFLAAWGNGIEPYNNYRRTGFPSNLQPTILPAPGPYYYAALYPAIAVNNNPNIPANLRTRRVFWDKANITLH
jgi:hypothetical protein